MDLVGEIVGLYRKAATSIPEDVVRALDRAAKAEAKPSAARVLRDMLENVRVAARESIPVCQDTGVPVFFVGLPAGRSRKQVLAAIDEATARAAEEVPMRPNAVDAVSGEVLGNRPYVHFEEAEKLGISLLLKGGGSENVSKIYKLPDKGIDAGRDLDGAARCVIDAVFSAQGKGCPPYIIGVAIGGDMEEAARLSKLQLMRKVGEPCPDRRLRSFESKTLARVNRLGIGPGGLGGAATALAVHAAAAHRHPACYFVGISMNCWCMRRASLSSG